jgi:gamma-glutamyl hercynylcysteine S-oxide synthase
MSPLAARWDSARIQTDALFEVLNPAALSQRPVAERHRLIFYLGHVEAFDWNMIGRGALNRSSFHPSFDKLFAFGIDPEPGRAPSDTPADWPSEQEVRAYGNRVRQELDDAVADVPDELLHVAAEHRLMHAETLAYLFHNLPYDLKRGPAPAPPAVRSPANSMVEVPTGTAILGRPRGDGFGWDNEFERQAVQVPQFRITRYKITNGEYLDYVRGGAAAPHFWFEREGRWFLRAMFGEIPLPLDWPVYVTQAEATAYARWRGARLPSEAEFHRAAEGAAPVNVGFERWDPVSVDFAGGTSRHGAAQLLGNGWEWTSTVFAPFPGFQPFPFYPGYSADFFDGKHFVMKGGSARTATCFLRPSFRNWFRPDYPYMYAGFRLVEGMEQ